MKVKSRNLFLLILSIIMVLSCACFFGMTPVKATEEDVFRVVGAGIRYEEPTGMRFKAEMSEDVYNNVVGDATKSFGAIILPGDYLADVGEITNHVTQLDGINYNEAEDIDATYNSVSGLYELNYSLATIQYGNYNRNFNALFFIKTAGVPDIYRYAAIVEGNNSRSVDFVAKADYANADTVEKAFLEEFIYQAEYLKDNPVATWSPEVAEQEKVKAEAYVVEQQAALTSFNTAFDAVVGYDEDAIANANIEYAKLGAFASSIVSAKKQALDNAGANLVSSINDRIVALEETIENGYVKSSYFSIYSLVNDYNSLPQNLKEQVTKADALAKMESEYKSFYDVKVLFDGKDMTNLTVLATESTKLPSADLVNYKLVNDAVLGNAVRATLNNSEEDGTVVFALNLDGVEAELEDYEIHTMARLDAPSYTGEYRYDRSFERLHDNNWGMWSMDFTNGALSLNPEEDYTHGYLAYDDYKSYFTNGNYVGEITFGAKLLNQSNFAVVFAPVFAIKENSSAKDLVDDITIYKQSKESGDFVAKDYYDIYALLSRYNAMTTLQQQNVTNIQDLLDIESAFKENYEVKVLFDGSDLSKLNVSYTYGTTIPSASLANAMVAEDDIVGNYLKATYTQTENNGYIVLTIDRSEVKDYDIHFQTKGVYDGTDSWDSDYLGIRSNYIKWAYEPHHNGNWGTVWAYAPSGATQSACSANVWAHSYIEASALNSQDSIYLGISLYGLDDAYVCVSPIVAIKLSGAVASVTAKITALSNEVDVNALQADDYYALNPVWNEYNNLSAKQQAKVSNAQNLLDIYNAYYSAYSVKVLFDGNDTSSLTVEAATPSEKSANGITFTSASDAEVGCYTMINLSRSDSGYLNIAVDRSEVKDYDIYFQTKGVYNGTDSWASDYLGGRNSNIKWAYESHSYGNWGTVWAYDPSGATTFDSDGNTWGVSYISSSAITDNNANTIYIGLYIYALLDAYVCVSPIVAIKAL